MLSITSPPGRESEYETDTNKTQKMDKQLIPMKTSNYDVEKQAAESSRRKGKHGKQSGNTGSKSTYLLRFANIVISIVLWVFLQTEIDEPDFCIWLAFDQIPILMCIGVAVIPEISRNQMVIGVNVCHTSLVYFLLVVNFVGLLRQVFSKFHAEYSELAPEVWEYKEFRRIAEGMVIVAAMKLSRKMGPADPLLITSFVKLILPIFVSLGALTVIYSCCKFQ